MRENWKKLKKLVAEGMFLTSNETSEIFVTCHWWGSGDVSEKKTEFEYSKKTIESIKISPAF